MPTASAISCCFLDTCLNCNKIASSRVWVWGSKCFWRILQKRFTRGSRSGVGLVPVAVNDYSAQKGGAEVVPAWCRPVSRLHCPACIVPPPLGPWPGAVRAVRGRCGRLRAALWRLRDALSGSTGNGFVSGALLPLVASPGGMRRPHILRSVEELRVICRVYRPVGCFGMRRYASVWFTCEVRVLARNVTVRHA